MTNISVFNFESFEVRFVGTAEKPEWIAQDVGEVLEIQNIRQNLADFDEDEKGVYTIYTLGGEQEMLTVTEAGLYRLIFKSRKPVAKRFQRWVFHDVLPTLRRTGTYTISTVETSSDNSLMSVQDQLAVFGYIFDGFKSAGVDNNIVESAKLTAFVAQFPNMAPAIEAAKESLMLQTPDEDHRYNPTDLGKKLAERLGLKDPISNRKINSALESVGFQVAEHTTNSKGKKTLIWHLTERGEVYGRLFLQSAQNNSKTIPSIRWVVDVLDEIVHLFDN